jgi:tyrosinase
MRLNTHVALCLLASTLSDALPSPQDESSATTTLSDGATTTLPVAASTNTAVASDQLDQLAAFAQEEVKASLEGATRKQKRGGCTLGNLAVRQEWYVDLFFYPPIYLLVRHNAFANVLFRGSLSSKQRKAYTSAVVCLQKKQSKTPASLLPGARSRFDDWVGTHINQTLTIHYTVITSSLALPKPPPY